MSATRTRRPAAPKAEPSAEVVATATVGSDVAVAAPDIFAGRGLLDVLADKDLTLAAVSTQVLAEGVALRKMGDTLSEHAAVLLCKATREGATTIPDTDIPLTASGLVKSLGLSGGSAALITAMAAALDIGVSPDKQPDAWKSLRQVGATAEVGAVLRKRSATPEEVAAVVTAKAEEKRAADRKRDADKKAALEAKKEADKRKSRPASEKDGEKSEDVSAMAEIGARMADLHKFAKSASLTSAEWQTWLNGLASLTDEVQKARKARTLATEAPEPEATATA